MFTDRTIPLSQVGKQIGINVVRDAQVAFAAKIHNPLRNRLVPCSTPQNVREALAANGVVAMAVPKHLADSVPKKLGLVLADNPLLTVLNVHEFLAAQEDFQWRSFTTQIDEAADVHPTAYVSGRDVMIAAGVRIDPKAVVLPRTTIGKNSIVGPGTVVGCDAFQTLNEGGRPRIIRQAGGVRIGERVELQANCTVSRAVFGGFTEIGDDTILDSQVHVGHDCQIGEKVLIANQASLAGRVEIQDSAYIAPNVTISNGLTLASLSKVTIGSVVLQNTKPGEKVTGYNAIPHEQWILQQIRARRR